MIENDDIWNPVELPSYSYQHSTPGIYPPTLATGCAKLSRLTRIDIFGWVHPSLYEAVSIRTVGWSVGSNVIILLCPILSLAFNASGRIIGRWAVFPIMQKSGQEQNYRKVEEIHML